ncbi:MAG TPA: hypothetical protein VN884_06855 [Candidatus Sulfotelmatobacter sp.]|jgi:hypothetical protein|nr:hypothetical protein [Candidatus Sulfotelmatobacter sp.]
MSNSSAAYRPSRRSTRVEQAIPLKVEGVDSFRGPYSEEVSTQTISCHGFKYLSKHQVLANALVVLELQDKKANAALSARGRVKWVERPKDPNGLFLTAVELESPGNIWGIDSPPQDWLPFTGARKLEMDTSKSKPFAVPRPETSVVVAEDKKVKGTGIQKPEPPRSSPLAARPAGQLMGDFQQQMEGMLAEAAVSAVRDKAASIMVELRATLREEARIVLAETSASQAGPWIEQSIKQLNKASQESARILYAQWKKKLETDVQQALERMEQRNRELEESSQSLAAKAGERIQGVLESSRKEGVGRIVTRLKEQMAPSIDSALKVTSDLSKRKDELEKALERSVEKSATRIEETSIRFEKQFEAVIRERLDGARKELEAQSKEVTQLALNNLRASGQKQSAEAERLFRESFQPIVDKALSALKEKAAETSNHFANELASYSQNHLEFVGGSLSELAKGIGKGPKGK